MQIEIRPKEGCQSFWEILIDGEKWREVHRTIFGRKPKLPCVPSRADWQEAFDAFEYQRAKYFVLWRLSSQSFHSEHLAKILRDRLVQSKTIDRLLDEFKAAGYLDDEAWLESFKRIQQKRYSLPLILTKLKAKGLSKETLQHLARDWKNPEEELSTIKHLLITSYRFKNLEHHKERQKVIVSLLRKGFSLELVREALNAEIKK